MWQQDGPSLWLRTDPLAAADEAPRAILLEALDGGRMDAQELGAEARASAIRPINLQTAFFLRRMSNSRQGMERCIQMRISVAQGVRASANQR